MPGSIKIDDGSGNYTILTNAGSLGSDKTITIPNETATIATTTATDLGGLVKVAEGSTAGSSAIEVDNCFSSTYKNYTIKYNFQKTGSGTANFLILFRDGSGDVTGSNYDYKYMYSTTSSTTWTTGANAAGQTSGLLLFDGGPGYNYNLTINVYEPNTTEETSLTSYGSWKDGGHLLSAISYDASTQLTGITFKLSTGTLAGSYCIYGYRDS